MLDDNAKYKQKNYFRMETDMTYDKHDEQSFIIQLQKMLSSLAGWKSDPALNATQCGDYNEQTRSAVTYFQKQNSLPPTGNVDFDTWEALYNAYTACSKQQESAYPIYPYPKRDGFKVQIGERSDLVLIIQLLLNELRLNYNCYGYIPPNGRFNLTTASAVREFQKVNGIETNGIVDRNTWNRIAEQYNKLE